MIEISSQMREFVNFAQDAVANDAKNAIARLGAKASRHSAFSIGTATDGDGVGKLRRSGASKNANNTVRAEFRRTVAQMFGGEDALDIDGMPVLIAEAQGDALLASFADTLAEWREALESFRPAAVAAAETKRTDSARPLSPDGFIEP